MSKKLSLRWRLTLLTSLIIAVCCIGLSLFLNASAYRMVNSIQAVPLEPAASGIPFEVPAAPMQQIMTSEATQQAKYDYLSESWIYTILAVLAGGLLTYIISGRALQPVKILNEQVKNINANNLDESLEVPLTGDEIAELTQSFNDMTDKLAQAFSLQKRFSADAAHELRTPLTVMQTKLDVFRKKEHPTTSEYEALTESLQKQITRLRGLVSELLEIASMESLIDMQGVNITTLLEEVVRELDPLAHKEGISIQLDCPNLFVTAQKQLLFRAFYNLVENALKYNTAGGSVTLTGYEEKEKIVIKILDTGIGISEEAKKHIFEPFYRADKSRSRKIGGAGLGLSLTQEIMIRHGGSISVSDNEISGSCFTVYLNKDKKEGPEK